jgi:hypothetical protein
MLRKSNAAHDAKHVADYNAKGRAQHKRNAKQMRKAKKILKSPKKPN